MKEQDGNWLGVLCVRKKQHIVHKNVIKQPRMTGCAEGTTRRASHGHSHHGVLGTEHFRNSVHKEKDKENEEAQEMKEKKEGQDIMRDEEKMQRSRSKRTVSV